MWRTSRAPSRRQVGRFLQLVQMRAVSQSCQTKAFSGPILLCTDFDNTCTRQDTLKLLFDQAQNECADTDKYQTRLNAVLAQYSHEYQEFFDNHSIISRDVPTVFQRARLEEFLAEYSAMDLRSIERVMENGLLGGISAKKLEVLADQIELLPECSETLAAMVPNSWIISSNWNRRMIETRFSGEINVIANELEIDDESKLTTGKIELRVQSPIDKANHIKAVRDGHPNAFIVYVGDSLSDLLGLVEADAGVIMGSDALLVRYADEFGIMLESIQSQALLDSINGESSNPKAPPVLFQAKNWQDIANVLGALKRSVQ